MCWVSQRSMPRVGTATTSGANGSTGGAREHPREPVGEPIGTGSSMDVEH